MFRLFVSFLIICCSFFSAAYAAQPLQQGFYIGGSVGSSEFDDDDLFRDNGLSLDDSDTAFGILAGYKFNRNFAVEARYTDTGSFEISDCCNSADIDTDVISIHAVGIIPFANGISIYGQLGIGSVGYEFLGLDEDEGVGSAGLGVSYNATANLSFAFQVDAYAWEDDDGFDDYDLALTTAQLVTRYTF
jgi:hypothetical protein